MKWTSEKPTKPGWYWWDSAPGAYPIIVKVDAYHMFHYGGREWSIGSTRKDSQWAGPIEEPTE